MVVAGECDSQAPRTRRAAGAATGHKYSARESSHLAAQVTAIKTTMTSLAIAIAPSCVGGDACELAAGAASKPSNRRFN